jgi:hypothetical protein
VTTDALDPGPSGDFPHWPRIGRHHRRDPHAPRPAHRARTIVYDPAPGNPDGTYAGPPEPEA